MRFGEIRLTFDICCSALKVIGQSYDNIYWFLPTKTKWRRQQIDLRSIK